MHEMNVSNMPGFAAESSLYRTHRSYLLRQHSSSAHTLVVPQEDPAALCIEPCLLCAYSPVMCGSCALCIAVVAAV
jgi:hypothetical protein